MNYSNVDARLTPAPRLNPAVTARLEQLRQLSRQARTLKEKMALAAHMSLQTQLGSQLLRSSPTSTSR